LKANFFGLLLKLARVYYNAGVVAVNSKVVGLAPGVDVMITIFCDFRQFSAKYWRFSQKPMLWHNLALFRVKNANFFAENILKIITPVPGHPRKRTTSAPKHFHASGNGFCWKKRLKLSTKKIPKTDGTNKITDKKL
jgi:hypothetical protein